MGVLKCSEMGKWLQDFEFMMPLVRQVPYGLHR